MNVHMINGPKEKEVVEVDPSFPKFVVFRKKGFNPIFDDTVEETAIILEDGSIEMYDEKQLEPYNFEVEELAYEIEDFMFLGGEIKIGFLDSEPRPSDQEITSVLSDITGLVPDIDNQENTEIDATEGLTINNGNISPPLDHDFSRTWQQHRSDYQRREAQRQHDEMMRDLSRRRSSIPRANFGIGIADYESYGNISSDTDNSLTADEINFAASLNNTSINNEQSEESGQGLLSYIREHNGSQDDVKDSPGLTLDRLREIGRSLFSNNSNQSNTDEDR